MHNLHIQDKNRFALFRNRFASDRWTPLLMSCNLMFGCNQAKHDLNKVKFRESLKIRIYRTYKNVQKGPTRTLMYTEGL